VFLSEPEVRSNDYLRQPVDHGAWLYACDDGEQILDRAPDFVPHYLFGKQPFAREFAKKYDLPVAASLMGAASMYPELAAQLRSTDADALFSPAPAGRRTTSKAVIPNRRTGRSTCCRSATTSTCWSATAATSWSRPVSRGVRHRHWPGQAVGQGAAAIRTLTTKPIQFIANTSFHPEHTGGNVALGEAGQDPSLPGSFFVQSRHAGVTGFFADPLSTRR
jgi:hypothetical protein